MTTTILTSESVTGGHPDKLCDQISDAVLDAYLAQDPAARVACETAASGNRVWIFGEITSTATVDLEAVARGVIRATGYRSADEGIDPATAEILVTVRQQSPDIAAGIAGAELGAGDQGVMFGYACNETPELMPLPISLAHALASALTNARTTGTIRGLRPDGKTQVSVVYEDGRPVGVSSVVISTQHEEWVELDSLRAQLRRLAIATIPPQFLGSDTVYHLNPAGRFVLGGPAADAGLTGRKIIVDTYGGAARHGGGAFSGKDATKVDRSAAYAARQAAKSVVASGLATRCEVSLCYGIGVAQPLAVNVDTFGTGTKSAEEIAAIVAASFDFRPAAIIERLGLRRPLYLPTATFGHFGRSHLPWEKVKDLR